MRKIDSAEKNIARNLHPKHITVLRAESIGLLNLAPNDNAVDATAGGGGHTEAMLEITAPGGIVLGIDRDPKAIERSRLRLHSFGARAVLVRGAFGNLEEIVRREKMERVRGVLFDLGVSSFQLEEEGRGFSLRRDEDLDMRMDPKIPRSAADLLEEASEEEIEAILREFGEERWSKRIAHAIVDSHERAPVRTTGELARIVEESVPALYRRGRLHPATKTFQALRIAVNGELDQLREGLRQAVRVLEPGGRIAAISFHSLEDRIVKNFFRNEDLLAPLTKKPILPTEKEREENPRARSAKLRCAVRNAG